jgi:hypothetical protein
MPPDAPHGPLATSATDHQLSFFFFSLLPFFLSFSSFFSFPSSLVLPFWLSAICLLFSASLQLYSSTSTAICLFFFFFSTVVQQYSRTGTTIYFKFYSFTLLPYYFFILLNYYFITYFIISLFQSQYTINNFYILDF